MLKKKTCSRAHTPPQAEEKNYFSIILPQVAPRATVLACGLFAIIITSLTFAGTGATEFTRNCVHQRF